MLIVPLTAVTLFLELAEDVWFREGFAWDAPIMLAIHSLSQPWLDTAFKLVTETAGPLVAIAVLITAVLLWRQRQWIMALLFPISFVGVVVLNTLLKAVFSRPRPTLFPPLVTETSYSFPSGHAMSAIAFYGLLALVLWHHRHYGWAILAGIWVPLVALSRVYLGVHYPSDVLASLTLGTVWLSIVWFVYTGKYASLSQIKAPKQLEALFDRIGKIFQS